MCLSTRVRSGVGNLAANIARVQLRLIGVHFQRIFFFLLATSHLSMEGDVGLFLTARITTSRVNRFGHVPFLAPRLAQRGNFSRDTTYYIVTYIFNADARLIVILFMIPISFKTLNV